MLTASEQQKLQPLDEEKEVIAGCGQHLTGD
jgi:hypothetical protein